MATKKPTTDVAVKQHGEIAPFAQESVPEYIKADGRRGSEEVKSSDMILPRLEIVQSQSPIKELPGNEEVRDGELFNSVSGEVYGDMVYFVPIYFKLEWLIWQDKDYEGGGFRGSFPSEDAARVKYRQLVEEDPNLIGQTKDGKEKLLIVDTPVHYGLKITPEGQVEQIVVSMPKTKAKISRKWNAMIEIAGGDRFGRVYKLSTFTDENKQGKKFKNFVIQPAGFAPKVVYEEAERIYETFREGGMQVAHGSVIDEDIGTDPATGDRGGI